MWLAVAQYIVEVSKTGIIEEEEEEGKKERFKKKKKAPLGFRA